MFALHPCYGTVEHSSKYLLLCCSFLHFIISFPPSLKICLQYFFNCYLDHLIRFSFDLFGNHCLHSFPFIMGCATLETDASQCCFHFPFVSTKTKSCNSFLDSLNLYIIPSFLLNIQLYRENSIKPNKNIFNRKFSLGLLQLIRGKDHCLPIISIKNFPFENYLEPCPVRGPVLVVWMY